MRLLQALVVVQLLASRVDAATPHRRTANPLIDIDPLAEPLDALLQLQQYAHATLEHNGTLAKRASGGCSLATATVRRDWEHMSKFDRRAYIKAVQCLQTKPSKSDPTWAPAAKTRYDDFVAVHVNQTMFIHGNGLFLTWHRYFVWAYEQALRAECDYTRQYWNWFSHTDDIFFAHNGSLAGARTISIPSGKGGGCIESGAFKNVQANIGPISPGMQGITDLAADITIHNPRCLRRDLSPYIPQKWFTTANLLNVTIGAGSKTHRLFWTEIQGRYPDGFLGLHTSGHYTMGGDATDLYSSVNDPAFWLHHAMLDRVYWIWQVLHLEEAKKVAGTLTLQDRPPTRNATIDEELVMGVNGETRKIRDMFDTLGDTPLCYVYA